MTNKHMKNYPFLPGLLLLCSYLETHALYGGSKLQSQSAGGRIRRISPSLKQPVVSNTVSSRPGCYTCEDSVSNRQSTLKLFSWLFRSMAQVSHLQCRLRVGRKNFLGYSTQRQRDPKIVHLIRKLS